MNKPAFIILLHLTFLGETIACGCMGTESVKKAFKRSENVFIGTVISSRPFELTQEPRGEGFIGLYYHNEVAFEVTEWYKGTPKETQLICTGTGGGDCGFHFQVGQQYIVYATKGGIYMGLEQSKMQTNICDRTNSLNDTSEDIAQLRKLRQ